MQGVATIGGAAATLYGLSMWSDAALWIGAGVGSCAAGLVLIDDGKPGGKS